MKFLRALLTIQFFLGSPASFLFAQSESVSRLILPSGQSTISFRWQGDSIHNKWEAHTAMLIPVKLKGCPRTFYMQFDLGAPASVFYQNKLTAIKARYPEAIPSNSDDGTIRLLPFQAGGLPIVAQHVAVKQFDSSSVSWADKSSIEIIGTIGTDLIDGKILVLDYPRKKIHVLPAITKKIKERVQLSSFTYINKSVLLPAKINAKETLLFFDTGSSMFHLLVNKETCLQLADTGIKPVRHEVRSWNRTLIVHTYTSSADIEITHTTLPLRSVTYVEGASSAQVTRMLKAGIGGMTGNKLFLQHVLILDTRNQQMGLTVLLKKSDLK